jgi:MoaA/NifB/PqqE/SkfB family radical SAM enzyme
MNAKIKARIDLENRSKLETVIPLRTPYIINIDPSDRCNFQCKFCPTGDRDLMKNTMGRSHGDMDFNLYKKIINDLCEFEDKIKVIRLYKDGEPLLNPHFSEMVEYAKKSGYCERVDSTTNASLLTRELSLKIINAGLDRINISVEGINEAQYADFSQYKIDYQRFVDNIRFFYENRKDCEMIVKINGDILTEYEQQKFYAIFGDIADGVFIESIMDCWPKFEQKKISINKERGIFGQKIQEVLVCPYVFYSLYINSNGTYSLCFLDWSRKMILGSVQNATPRSVWNSKELKDYQKMFLQGNRHAHPICDKCGQLRQGQPDNIDAFANELLEAIS